MKYNIPSVVTYSKDDVANAIEAAACGSTTGSCYGNTNCGCSYST